MKFLVSEEVFVKLPTACFGVVVARNLDNHKEQLAVGELLAASVAEIEQRFAASRVKEAEPILPYRTAFQSLGINPNKFMSSIEAMASRIEKKKGFPQINPVVDLGNAISLKYLVPLGAHDLDSAAGDIQVRFSRRGDQFIPFGEELPETLEDGELIYSVGDKVKTRRWIWRQSEEGKVTEASRNIFFPIDGFTDSNQAAVLQTREELAALLQRHFGCETIVGWVDQQQSIFEF